MVFEKLAEILEDIFELDEGEVSLQTRFEEDLYADMQDLIEIGMILEEEFDILTDDEDLAKLQTVGDMVEYIKGHIDE